MCPGAASWRDSAGEPATRDTNRSDWRNDGYLSANPKSPPPEARVRFVAFGPRHFPRKPLLRRVPPIELRSCCKLLLCLGVLVQPAIAQLDHARAVRRIR